MNETLESTQANEKTAAAKHPWLQLVWPLLSLVLALSTWVFVQGRHECRPVLATHFSGPTSLKEFVEEAAAGRERSVSASRFVQDMTLDELSTEVAVLSESGHTRMALRRIDGEASAP